MDGPMIDRQQSWSNAGMKMSSYLRRLRFLVEDTCGVELRRFDAVLETSGDRVVVGYIVAGALPKQPLTQYLGSCCRGQGDHLHMLKLSHTYIFCSNRSIDCRYEYANTQNQMLRRVSFNSFANV